MSARFRKPSLTQSVNNLQRGKGYFMRNLWLPALLLILAGNVFGQTTSINGTVTDPSGSVIPNATITLVNTETGVQRSTVSDSQGRYVMPQLAPGPYKLMAKAAGFSDVEIAKVELQEN